MKTPFALTLALVVSGCLADLSPEVGPAIAGQCSNEDSDEGTDVSFQADILPMLTEGCGCHSPKSTTPFAIDSTGFSVGSRASVLRGGQKSGSQSVVPGEPCSSQVYTKCTEAPPYGARMPLYGPYFTPAQMQLLHDWIAEGARAK
ncbi:MAG: hypothetical protein RL385_5395 [Pseudomonadota bacterium]